MHSVCPVCKSDRIDRSMYFVTGSYKCLDCGYVGGFIIEMDDNNYKKYLEEE